MNMNSTPYFRYAAGWIGFLVGAFVWGILSVYIPVQEFEAIGKFLICVGFMIFTPMLAAWLWSEFGDV